MRDAEYLAGPAEVAQVLGIASNTVNAWRRRANKFPEPLVQLKAGALWDIRDVIDWADRSGRRVMRREYRAPRPAEVGQ